MTALRDFEQLTGKPVTVLDGEIQDYAVTIHDLLSGKVKPGQFLTGQLADTRKMLKRVQGGLTRRFLYHVKKAG